VDGSNRPFIATPPRIRLALGDVGAGAAVMASLRSTDFTANRNRRIPPNDIKAIAAEFSVPVEYGSLEGEEKIKLPADNKSLKTPLRCLDERYYRSPLSKTNFLTNSTRAV